MHTPPGCALMGWVPYPAHMGPRFAGPITALRAFKNKKINKIYMSGCRWVPSTERNLGQKLCYLGVNVRLICAFGVRIWPKLIHVKINHQHQTTNCWYFLVNYIIVWPTCIKLYLDCLWANLSGWIMRLIKIQYPFLEKIPLCRERKYCGIEHTEFIEVVNLFISSFICNLEFIS